MQVNVRRLEAPDTMLLRTLRLRSLQADPRAFGSTHARELEFTDERWSASLGQLAWFAALEGDVPVGLVSGVPADEIERQSPYLIALWVEPGRRNHGVAELLVAAVCDWARQTSATGLVLDVAEDNDRARRLFERLGFRPTGASRRLESDRSRQTLELRLSLCD
jgi:RimJ/RimL family protein N-acetyltransferase